VGQSSQQGYLICGSLGKALDEMALFF